MSGFSPEWLALREPVDHRSRDPQLAQRLASHFAGRGVVHVVDLGYGTGSNLRGTFHLLPVEQHWTLVDYDRRLLAAAREAVLAWADDLESSPRVDGGALWLSKGDKRLRVDFRQADLNADLDEALGPKPDLVTASAFFDLCSMAFINRLAAAVANRSAVFFTVLTYNGVQSWTPAHEADAAMREAFVQHQANDKGFGPSTGPNAPAVLAEAFRAADYRVDEGDSPWDLAHANAGLFADLAAGFAAAVAETGAVNRSILAAWSAVTRVHAVVGHTDTLALPPA